MLRPLAILCILLSFRVAAASVSLDSLGIDTVHTAIIIRDLRDGSDLISLNPTSSMVPASVTKAVTVASLLNLGDLSERFSTEVVMQGEVRDSVLHGNVIVRTIGDPTIESSYFPASQGIADSIASRLVKGGIRQITGDIIISEDGFQDPTVPTGTMHEDIMHPYGATLHGANFHDNRFNLYFPSERTVPSVPGLRFVYSNPRDTSLRLDRGENSETLYISGNHTRNRVLECSMPLPARALQAAVKTAIERAAIKITCDTTITVTHDETPLYTHLSPTFGAIMQTLMFRSHNLMAEGMLRAIAPGGTRAAALTEEMTVWKNAGLDTAGVRLYDGSGLSRSNRLTAKFLSEVLASMTAEEYADDYTSLFPRVGREGTVRNFLKGTPLEGVLALKTGSMRGVQSYAGYKFDTDGKPTHVIVIIANDFKCSRPALKNRLSRLLLEIFDVSLQDIPQSDDSE